MPAVQKNKSKEKTRKFLKGPRQLKLKGWLKTPEQWNKFNEWVKVNGLPRKVPELEPIVREAKPLGQLKKRLAVLATPAAQPPTDCVVAGVSRAALRARPSKALKRLALPRLGHLGGGDDDCKRDPLLVSRAALRYKPSANLLMLALPSARPESCQPDQPAVSRAALGHQPTPTDLRLSRPKPCPQHHLCRQPWHLRCNGPEMTPWMEFLALPSWRVLKEQNSENAKKWKEQILNEIESRAKEAYEEQQRKRLEQKKREERERKQKQEGKEEEKKTTEPQSQKSKTTLASGKTTRMVVTNVEGTHSAASGISEHEHEGQEGEDEEEEDKEEEWEDIEDYGTEIAGGALATTNEEQPKKPREKCKSRPKKKFGPPKKCEEGDKKCEEKEKKKQEKRKKQQSAWRFSGDATCKKNPPKIPKAALEYQASPDIQRMAQPKKVKSITCRKDPFKVKESAKNASPTPEIMKLAEPKHTCDPVQRPPPREHDEFGRPILPKPPYGKKLPKPKPYPQRECPKKDEEQKAKEEEPKKNIPLDPLVFAPTIDPLFDPTMAVRQARLRANYKDKLKNTENESSEAEETSVDNSDNVSKKTTGVDEKSAVTSQKSDVESLKSAKSNFEEAEEAE